MDGHSQSLVTPPRKGSGTLERPAALGILIPATVFVSAFLLFQVQPIAARYILPWFGGGPAVWTSCLLFFQAGLLAGYLYAHWLASRAGSRAASLVHLSLLAASLFFLPIRPNAAVWKAPSGIDPSLRILMLLGATAGVPYLLLSSTGPLLQRWFTASEPSRSPWRLYALSNLGSLIALLTYPFAVEPYLRLDTQVLVWSAIYVVFAVLCGATAWGSRSIPTNAVIEADDPAVTRPAWGEILFWTGLAACGSTLLVSTTNQISQEIAVNPFLWVAPLAFYLLTFVLTFESARFYRRIVFACATGVLAPIACVMPSLSGGVSLRVQLFVYLLAMFATCILCHGELAASRPAPRHLTIFYVAIAAGGALGGVFVALIAPHLFTEFTEYPIGLASACLLGFLGWLRGGAMKRWTSGNLAVRVPLMALLFGGITAIMAAFSGNQPAVASARNFYGVLRVLDRSDGNGEFRELRHGRTRHGFQYLKGPQRAWATTYYGPHSGVALALNALDGANRRIAVVGLGAGTLAAWGRAGDVFRFFEINPDVDALAQRWFSFLKDSKARTEIVLGDARVQLERELAAGHTAQFDLIAVDAFTSDAIPFHLLTVECADVYRRSLAPGGLLLLHISNRVLNLEPVARGMAQHLGWKTVLFVSGDDPETGESASKWVLLTANADLLARSGLAQRGAPWNRRAPILWTDDFVSLWHVLNF